jgi:hypothetical protein
MSNASQGAGWWLASDGRWYPPAPADGGMASPSLAASPVPLQVGDITVTGDEVLTPVGRTPLRGTTWIITNQTQMVERIPSYAIVLAIIFALLCLIGLLFLLIKERTVQGFVQVTVQGPNFYYATQIPVSSPAQIADVEQRVNYIRGLVLAQPG